MKEPFELKLPIDSEFEAFRDLKKKLVPPPVLALFCYGYKYILLTDACDYQVGYALVQEQPNGDKLLVGYWGRTLAAVEGSYSKTER